MAVIKIKPILVHVNASNIIAHVIFNIYRGDEWALVQIKTAIKKQNQFSRKRLLEK